MLASPLRVNSPILIGRAREQGILARALELAHTGRGQTLLLTGEAGIGKTRLARQAVTLAAKRDFQIWQGRCFEQDRAQPYAPWIDLLRQLPNPALASATPSNRFAPLAQIAPELFPSSRPLKRSSNRDADVARRQISLALAAFLTQRLPALVLVEDLHWCDESSLDFLLDFARRLETRACLLLLTARSDEATPALDALLAALARERGTVEIAVPRLTPDEAHEMIRAILEETRPVRAEFLEALYELTEGNPFFIEEIIQALIPHTDLVFARGVWDRKPLDQLKIPRSIQGMAQQRMKRLDDASRHVLQLAAVSGRRFDIRLLKEVMALDERGIDASIRTLLDAQLLIEESADQFAFRHALAREAVYATLLRRERRSHHRAILQALEYLQADGVEVPSAELAYHALRGQWWDKALDYAQRASEDAQRLHAPRAAFEQLQHAFDAAQQLGQSPTPSMWRQRGRILDILGEFDAARDAYGHALARARELQDARAVWDALFDLGFFWTGSNYARANDYLQQALAAARDLGDSQLIAQSLNRIGNWQMMSNQARAGLASHHEALAIFETLADVSGLAATYDFLGIGSYIAGDMVQTAAYYARAIPLLRKLQAQESLASALAPYATCGASYNADTCVGVVMSRAQAHQDGEEALRVAQAIAWRPGEAMAWMYLALDAGPRGEFARGMDCAKHALNIAQEIGHMIWLGGAQMAIGRIAGDLLDWELARTALNDARQTAQQVGARFFLELVTGFLASAEIALGDLKAARARLDAMRREMPEGDSLALRSLAVAEIEWSYANDDPKAALARTEALLAHSPNVAEGGVIPRVWLLRGRILHRLKRYTEAEQVLRAAAATAQARGLDSLWQIYLALGKTLAAQRRRDEAEAQFAIARTRVTQLAEAAPEEHRTLFVERARALIPARPPTTRQRARQEFDGLTARERAVAVLIARGNSNREIADTLVVSERTVATHIGNIMNKLGFSSRTQIAAWAIQKGLVT